jgi:hypothetical protein
MAVRLQMKLGIVAETDRLPDSPDTVVVVEPSIGSTARSKGSLYLLVTSRVPGVRLRELTRMAAETIRNEYYYDESAGIRVCIEKAINLVNKRLAHQRDRLGSAADGAGPIGVAVAVVRGSELYVATVGPAEAYLIRSARLSTLPDPGRGRGLPAPDVVPDVWRGELAVGDSLVLISPNVVSRLGPDELKDAMVTLHPQSAMEHLHHRFVAADGAGSDGAVALEATEVTATTKHRTLVPVKPLEPLAGAPDRSPIPLADDVSTGVAAVSASARSAGRAAGGLVERVIRRAQDLFPRREPAYRKVTPYVTKRETQRRAAVAVLAFILVIGGLGLGVWWAGGAGTKPKEQLASLSVAQRALEAARADIGEVFGPGVDLVDGDPERALELLRDAYGQLDTAASAGIPASVVDPLREQTVDGLDRLFKVIEVRSSAAFSFESADPPVDLVALIRGPDGVPYVIDRTANAVYRIDLAAKKATVAVKAGQAAAGTKVAEPRFVAVGGPDLYVLDAKNVLWRWRPSDTKGKGTLIRLKVKDAASWGDDVRAIGTYCRNAPDCDLNNLYVVDPSEEQIRAYAPAADGSGYPGSPTAWLATTRDVSGIGGILIDGDIYLLDAGVIARFTSGKEGDWSPLSPGDELLRPAPRYARFTSPGGRREGLLYAFDDRSDRLLSFRKDSGDYVEQYRSADGDREWADMRGMYVIPGVEEGPATLVWIDGGRLWTTVLEQALGEAPIEGPSPSPPGSGEPSPSAAPPASPAP